MSINRVEKGIPAGGQFAADTHAEPDVALAAVDHGDHLAPVADGGMEQAKAWVAGQASHHLSPVIGWIRRDAAKGKDTSAHLASFHERAGRLADDVVERFTTSQALQQRTDATDVASEAIYTHLLPVFNDLAAAADDDSRLTATRWRVGAAAAAEEIAKKVTGPAPVLNGFTAAEVEDYLAREQHERQCACDLKDDICYTESYGEHWRHRMGVPDVEGIFDTMREMAAARDAGERAGDLPHTSEA